MNLPISAASAAASGAAKLVRHVADGLANGVQRAADFDAVLRSEPETDLESLRTESVNLIREALTKIGIEANPPLRLDVTFTGDVRLTNDHPRAAEIELQLSSNTEIQAATKRLAAAGATQLTIGPA